MCGAAQSASIITLKLVVQWSGPSHLDCVGRAVNL